MQYFFSTDISHNKIILSKEESIHCMTVLRHDIGDMIYIVDGKGVEFTCKITNASKGCVEAEIIKKQAKTNKSNHYIHIVIAPTKSSQRLEWFIEKAVEIGVDEISFIKCSNSERKKINMDRIHKVALMAMKQSLKTFFPNINDIDPFTTVISRIPQKCKYIGYLGNSSNKFLNHIAPKNSSYCLFIGPEGDFTDIEVDFAVKNDFTPILLSNSRLRTETAGIAGCLTLNEINHD